MYNNYGSYGYGLNPYQTQMDRLNQMQMPQQTQPQQIQQQQIQPQQSGVLPVGSIEEVKAFNNYFDGQPHYFMDSTQNKIYIKQLGVNGIPSINTYSLEVPKEVKTVEYATKEEVDTVRNTLDQLLKQLGGAKENE